jgi:leucine-zipper of insertion element IS481
MDIHKNARLTVHGRERIVHQVMSGQTPEAVALAAGVLPADYPQMGRTVPRRRSCWPPRPQLAAT